MEFVEGGQQGTQVICYFFAAAASAAAFLASFSWRALASLHDQGAAQHLHKVLCLKVLDH